MTTNDVNHSRLQARLIVRAVMAIAMIDGMLFGLARRVDWPGAWWLTAILAAMCLTGIPWLVRHDPDLLHERMSRAADNVPAWDKRLMGIYRWLFFAFLVTASLDAGRFRWSHMTPFVQFVGAIVLIASIAGIWWCLAVNHFLASYARLQQDRGQTVVQNGPYRYVRHPMYTSLIAFMYGFALLVGSWLALIPAACITMVFVVRTMLEDRMLTTSLEGYRAYTMRVPNRLLPGVW